MQVQTAINQLQELNPSDHIIIAWWAQDSFDIPEEDWEHLCLATDYNMDWSNTHDDLTAYYDYIKVP